MNHFYEIINNDTHFAWKVYHFGDSAVEVVDARSEKEHDSQEQAEADCQEWCANNNVEAERLGELDFDQETVG